MASVTSRYARAFADVVLANSLEARAVRQQLDSLGEILRDSPDLGRVWENPAVPLPQKIRLLDSVAARLGMPRQVRNFVAVLIEHRRIGQLGPIVRQFEQELNQRLGVAEAEVTSARELGPEERRALESQIERMTGRTVVAHYVQDQSLLGGAVVRVGSTIYDGSVRGQLEKIREELSTR